MAVFWGLILSAAAVAATNGTDGVTSSKPAQAPRTTTITSDQLTFDMSNNVVRFTKNVVVTDAGVIIKADKMQVKFGENDDIKWIRASGHVRIQQKNRLATCRTATYNVRSGALVLVGKPVVRQGASTLRGRVIKIWRDQQKMEAIPGNFQLEQRAKHEGHSGDD